MKLEYSTDRIKIRPLKISDADDMYQHIRFREISRWTKNIPYPYPRNGAEKFIQKKQREFASGKSYNFGIILNETDKLIGSIGLGDIKPIEKKTFIGYWLSKDFWGRGIMTEAVNLVLDFGFNQLKLHKISAGIFSVNTGSKRVLEKCGFKREGLLRDERFKRGSWHDEFRYGILKTEFKSRDTF
ncbi:MAG: GNAT family N-acetyltransferase [Candidatus Altiarchaeota archaeon]|nr:GNAT family N-acetyltransferase [Candidatus Altiarchaeota archaeon]